MYLHHNASGGHVGNYISLLLSLHMTDIVIFVRVIIVIIIIIIII